MSRKIAFKNGALRVCKDCGVEAFTEADLEDFKRDKACLYECKNLCKKCSSVRSAASQSKNKDKNNKTTRTRYQKRKIDAIVQMGGKCVLCNLTLAESHFSVFDFHHIDPKEKEIQVAKLFILNKEKISKELSKCTLLCSNCHRQYHHNVATQYKLHRRLSYNKLNQMELISDDSINGTTTHRDAILAIKAKYPKPNMT